MRSHVSTKASVSRKTLASAGQDGTEPLVSSVSVWFLVSMGEIVGESTSADACQASLEIIVR